MKIFTREFLNSIRLILMNSVCNLTIKVICKKMEMDSPEIILAAIKSKEFWQMYPCQIEAEGFNSIEDYMVFPLPVHQIIAAIAFWENTGKIGRLKTVLDAYKATYAMLYLHQAFLYLGYSLNTINVLHLDLGKVCYADD